MNPFVRGLLISLLTITGPALSRSEASTAGPGTPTQSAINAQTSSGAPAAQTFESMVDKADPKAGQSDAKVCAVCHNFQKGAGIKIGPNLYGVVGRQIASNKHFEYSDALKKLTGRWDPDKLNAWIKDPAAMAPGTKMTFSGISSESKRAAIVAYLKTLSDHPKRQ